MKSRHWIMAAVMGTAFVGYLFWEKPDTTNSQLSVNDAPLHPTPDHSAPTVVSSGALVQSAFAAEMDDSFRRDLLTGAVERGAQAAPAASVYPAAERAYLSPDEKVRVPFNRGALSATAAIILRADHGGVLDGHASSPQVELPGDATGFTFHAGAHRGLYTVTVRQGARVETLEFWVGAESPAGRAGPSRTLTLPASVLSGS